jgi:hypothetical protein
MRGEGVLTSRVFLSSIQIFFDVAGTLDVNTSIRSAKYNTRFSLDLLFVMRPSPTQSTCFDEK